ncbi:MULTISPECIES: MBL fold metallo-hydrolase [unclassified Mesorhizobium]|uniref:MBL fold metallo-hydrolase n=1 Tax=unclassified Mesorhizobium TaxID=325217 RepID=UPI00112A7AC0|nr:MULTISPECIES: MBL fold metallo-hydrolase [unclassified Mesorhizobium]TPK45839.1 MBL fold metallo-hydrolase [Mesorhizobium sp. B2-5-2]TPL16496.1 MBL fold metallo-hydrolase [Mesorhizobium sp. B2-4-9]TPL16699.1 MBL fold metallo-hydrolase [Mesorhizobium sp. B2-4-7]TPL33332.1 MBL fold metallo-hydrolase [Mesorhizobium sp. B2-4-5]TPM70961.1 MBL fold metallo-hydrolase [Mesorhizobium sp. B2-1-6]
MKLDLAGGFGEKGRTSVAVRSGNDRILLDIGIKVGATGAEYYPALDGSIADIDALFVSHAHEDHVGALSWLLSRGYAGPIFMTAETRAEAPATLAGYADPGDLKRFPFPEDRIEIFEPGDLLKSGNLRVRTGRSGHVVGGVWFAVDDGKSRVVYSADVVPDSNVFVMDAIPECDLLVLDASYGADPVPGAARAEAISGWVARHSNGCLLPTPLSGRSLELIAALPGPFAIHAGMRASLEAQIAATSALLPGVSEILRLRLGSAADWTDADPLPSLPLLADDGMGEAGPSSRLLPRADRAGFPVLLTGHLPSGSPGDLLHKAGRADWVRMPTHPTLSGNVGIWEKAGRPETLGHSCASELLDDLKAHIPSLRPQCRTGQSITVRRGNET